MLNYNINHDNSELKNLKFRNFYLLIERFYNLYIYHFSSEFGLFIWGLVLTSLKFDTSYSLNSYGWVYLANINIKIENF